MSSTPETPGGLPGGPPGGGDECSPFSPEVSLLSSVLSPSNNGRELFEEPVSSPSEDSRVIRRPKRIDHNLNTNKRSDTVPLPVNQPDFSLENLGMRVHILTDAAQSAFNATVKMMPEGTQVYRDMCNWHGGAHWIDDKMYVILQCSVHTAILLPVLCLKMLLSSCRKEGIVLDARANSKALKDI
jgi:hypothetical protein